MKLRNILSRKSYIIILLILSFAITSIWFKSGKMIAIAEEGLVLNNPLRTFNLYKQPWMDVSLGYLSPLYTQRLSFLGAAAFFNLLFPQWFSQAIIFFILLATALIGFYMLTDEFIDSKLHRLRIYASLFYFSNLFVLSQIFGRFIYGLIFAWAYLPLFLFLWIRWVSQGETRSLILLVLSSLIYSNAFSIPATIIAFALAVGLWTADFVFRETKQKLTVVKRLSVILVILLIANIWWVFPFFQLRNNNYSSANLVSNASITSISDISKYFTSDQIIQLKQSYYFGKDSAWKEYFHSPLRSYISLIALILMIIGALNFKKNKNGRYLLLLFIVSWFFVKGTNPPFGKEFFSFIFQKLPFTQVIRNPYEKLGIALLIPYSIFFSLGVFYLSRIFNKYAYIVSSVIIFFVIFYLPLPIWNGKLFKNYYFVEVPTYYETANEYINKNYNGRILQLPFLRGSSIVYDWNYRGEEPSEYLFDHPSISKTFSLPQYDDFYSLLGNSKYFSKNRYYSNLLKIMNVDTIVIHNDTKKASYYQENVNEIRDFVNIWKDTNHVKNVGKLEIFSLTGDLGYLYCAGTLNWVDNLDDAFDAITNKDFLPSEDAIAVRSRNINMYGNIESNKPFCKYRKINPQKYVVDIDSYDSRPFIVILTNNYNVLWSARIDGSSLNRHFEVNGYANGWYVEKKGNFSVDIIFKIWPWQ
jgi:hypothetical protein